MTETKSGPAFSSVTGSSVVAVMSRNAEKAKSYAIRHDIPKWYDDAQQLINNPDVNAVYIATPPSSHATFAIMAMKARKPVYVEKPLAASYDDCIRINRVSEQTGVPCFVAYYRRYLPYFIKVKQLVEQEVIGDVRTVQLFLACPPRDLDYNSAQLPWRLQPDISGGGYFYDLAPHQLDILQHIFGVITDAKGICTNRAHLYETEDCVSACFQFENGITGSASWCFVTHQSAKEDRIEVIGEKGKISFSVYNYDPILVVNEQGTRSIQVSNPPYVQLPIIRTVIEQLQGTGVCQCTSVSATPVNWVMDRILGKF